MGNYLETYFSRVNFLGKNVAEVATNAGIRSFEKWLSESPNVPQNELSIRDEIFFKGIILSDKDSESKKIKHLLVSLDIPIEIGDIVKWDDEFWLVYQKEKKVRELYQTFYIIKCNYNLKWIDDSGFLCESYCYFLSSLDTKIKENFRTWNSLITPLPNKYAEIILPTHNISRHTKFIVEDEGWYVVEMDFSSVKGITYLSLTEDKINSINDDLENDIADIDKLASYKFVFPKDKQIFKVGEIINPVFSILKNGNPVIEKTHFSLEEKGVLSINKDKEIFAAQEGKSFMKIILTEHPEFYTIYEVEVNNSIPEQNSGYIYGKDKIKLDNTNEYEIILLNSDILDFNFSISDEKLVRIEKIDINKCKLTANDDNLLGTVELTAKSGDLIFTKTITIVPLW